VNTKDSVKSVMQSRPMRIAQIALGGLLMLVAPLTAIPTPPPTGTVVFALGLALVLRNSLWAKRRYLRWTKPHPRIRKAVDFGLQRKQKRDTAGRRWWQRRRLIEGSKRG
jgi:hypothetical protein